jgi:hypothetical protein
VPKQLAEWAPWVLAGDEARSCPVRDGHALCFWPSALLLELNASGGRFTLDATLDKRMSVGLPGARGSWPTVLRVDGATAVVGARDDLPVIELAPGRHRIEGQFRWPRLPQHLALPAQYGLIDLRVNGARVLRPKRDDNGSLWLQREAETEQAAQLDLTVQRKWIDGVPLQVDTRIRVRAAGEPREVDLGSVLPSGAVPMTLDAELPARIDARGRLQVQVRAGSWELRIMARVAGAPQRLENPARPEPWPKEEAWAFQADEALRQVELSGARAVDPARLELPEDWRRLPAFTVAQREALQLKTLRRGDPDPLPDQLDLQRTLWLDQDGHGYSVRDHITGELHGALRLELRGHTLGRAVVHGRDQLVTQLTAAGASGVELRDRNLDLQADWRADELGSRLPAVAWSHDVQSLALNLRLPPGYSLFAASGVDHVDRSWVTDWDLLGFFFVLLLALGTGRIAGVGYGLVAFAALGLAYQEPDAPRGVWIALLVLVALLRMVPPGRLQMLLRIGLGVTLLVFLSQALPFAARSLREAIYPQLGVRTDYESPHAAPGATGASPEAVEREALKDERSQTGAQGAGLAAESLAKLSRAAGYAPPLPPPRAAAAPAEDPDAVVQTGPGLPDWHWQRWQLSWSGPVQRDHVFELWILPPLINRILAVLRVVLAALLAYGLWRGLASRLPRRTGVASALLLMVAGASAPVRADFPDPSLLNELHARLTKPAECQPQCVNVSELRVNAGADGLELDAEVHAQAASSVRIAGPVAVWAPDGVSIDNAPAALVLGDDGFLHARLLPGVHRVRAVGLLPAQDVLTLRLGDRPAQVTVQAQGYDVNGVREDGTVDDALELKRRLPRESDEGLEHGSELPPWLSVTRELDLGFVFRVHTTVRRETPLGTAVSVHVPLLQGEAVNDARVQVQGRDASLTLGPDDAAVSFDSSLTQREQIAWVAGPGDRYSEIWRVRCGSSWHCRSAELTPISRVEGDTMVELFRPWPGDKLSLTLRKPAPSAGQSTTVDAARLAVTPGLRQSDLTLTVAVRTSRGGTHDLRLPPGARVRSLSIDGAPRPVHVSDGVLSFGLQPGAANLQLELEWPQGKSHVFDTPALKLDVPIANARLAVSEQPDSWLLWVRGPEWGPAILFWGYLAFALLAAAIVARIGRTPLAPYEWLLLAIGLTQIEPAEGLCVVAFFFAFAWRARTLELPPLRHDLLQLVLIGLTFAAAGALFDAVEHGLLMRPDMQIAGAASGGSALEWYVDRTSGEMPRATIISAPLWAYRALMLVWALWLASALLRWVPWSFRAFVAGGAWKRRRKAVRPQPSAAGPAAGGPAASAPQP